MSICSVNYVDSVRVHHKPSIPWIPILLTLSLILMIVAILAIVLSTTKDHDSFQADPIPVVKNSITPIPVPTPPPAKNLTIPLETPTPASQGIHEPFVLPVPVPTPPS